MLRSPSGFSSWLVLAFVLASVVCLPRAEAHLGSNKYIRVERTAGGVHVSVEIEAVDAAMELGLGSDASPREVLAHADALRSWLAHGVTVRADAGACASEVGTPTQVERDQRAFLAVPMIFTCPPGASGLILRDDTIFDGDPQHEAMVHVAYADSEDATILRHGSRELSLGAAPGAFHLVKVFVVEGVMHLFTGYDHMLFLFSLMLGAGFVAQKRGLRMAFRDVAILVTAFTFGHSITLISAALGWVVLPSRLVETLIAASIVLVALLNLFRPGERGAMPKVAFGFGLIHGFGFSSVLSELGLPRDHAVLALLSFNVGIELAQLSLVLLTIVPLERASRWRGFGPVIVRGGSILVVLIAGYWMITRAFAI
ncbi:MAG: HupE/UreJ family protein [Deltaproteobacteria bacterium]|nr:HupE/UreJ family protein [Deltaproteobacteria bacterium]